MVGRDWTCYSVGAGRDISFDVALAKRFGARILIVEPVSDYVRIAGEQSAGLNAITVRRAALSAIDGPVRMQVNSDPDSDSVSSADLWASEEHTRLPGRSLSSLMAEHGDAAIDFFKLDVEGAEYDLLDDIDLRALDVKVFAVQLHANGSLLAARSLLRRLDAAGYELVGRREVVKLTFVRRDLL